MNSDDLPHELICAFAEAILTAPVTDLPQKERSLREQLKDLGLYPEALVHAQSDEMLAQALKHGFFLAESSEEFYVRFEPMIRAWLVKWGAHYHKAFDVAQLVLWRCFGNGLARYDAHQGTVTASLKRAAYKVWIEQDMRARKAIMPGTGQLHGEESDAMAQVIAQELAEQIHRALPGLSPEQRAVIVSALAGKSPDEIAEEWGCILERGGSAPLGIIKPLALRVAAVLFGSG